MSSKEYIVKVKEIHIQDVIVKANNEQEAITKVLEGQGDYGNGTEYNETMDSDTWEVEEA